MSIIFWKADLLLYSLGTPWSSVAGNSELANPRQTSQHTKILSAMELCCNKNEEAAVRANHMIKRLSRTVFRGSKPGFMKMILRLSLGLS